jgi:ABC-type uncharacterized transport system permease subunit
VRVFLIVVRALAVLVGLFLVASSIADVCGLSPYSMQMPPLRERIVHSIPIAVASLALLIPYHALTSAVARWIVMSILLLFAAYFLFITVAGLHAYAVGEKSWHVIPASLVLSSIFAANLYAFFTLTSRARAV